MTNPAVAVAEVTGPGMRNPAVVFALETRSIMQALTSVLAPEARRGMTTPIAVFALETRSMMLPLTDAFALETRFGTSIPTVVFALETKFGTSIPTNVFALETRFGTSIPTVVFALETRFGMSILTDVFALEARFGMSILTVVLAQQTRSGITHPTAVYVPRDWYTMNSITTAPAPMASTTTHTLMSASAQTPRSFVTESVSAPSRARYTLLDMAVTVQVTKWSMMVRVCALTVPAVMTVWSMKISYVDVSLLNLCVRVWQSAKTMTSTAQISTLTTSAPKILATVSGSALKQNLRPSRH